MDNKVAFIRYLMTLPESRNFSEYEVNEDVYFDKSDDGFEEENFYNQVFAEKFILSLLTKLSEKQKMVLLYCVIMSCGFNFTQYEISKSLDISRSQYQILLGQVRNKTKKFLQESKKNK